MDSASQTSLGRAFNHGLQSSIPGLASRGKKADALSEADLANLSATERFALGLGQIIGDTPAYAGFGLFSAPAGPMGAMAGSIGFTEALRSTYVQALEKGEFTSFKDFLERAGLTALETVKGGLTGAGAVAGGMIGGNLTAGLSAGARAAGTVAGEVAGLTGMGSAVEGQFPSLEDFAHNAALILAVKGGTAAAGAIGAGKTASANAEAMAGKLREIYKQTGVKPETVVEDIKANPEYARSVFEDPRATDYVSAKSVESAAGRMGKDPLAYLRETMVNVMEVEPKFSGKDFRDIIKDDVPLLRKELLQGPTDRPNPYGKPYPWDQMGLDVHLSRNVGFDHMVDSAQRRGMGRNDQATDIHMEAVANFPKLMKNAVLGETAPDPMGKYKAEHRTYSCMRVNGETYVVKLTILEELAGGAKASIDSVQKVRDLQLAKKMPSQTSNIATFFDVLDGLDMTKKEFGGKGDKGPKTPLIGRGSIGF